MAAEDRQPEMAVAWLKYGDGPGHYHRTCPTCGRAFYSLNVEALYCSEECSREGHNALRRARGQEAREKVCAWCGKPFEATRRDGRFCPSACRQAAYRQRLGSGLAREP